MPTISECYHISSTSSHASLAPEAIITPIADPISQAPIIPLPLTAFAVDPIRHLTVEAIVDSIPIPVCTDIDPLPIAPIPIPYPIPTSPSTTEDPTPTPNLSDQVK